MSDQYSERPCPPGGLPRIIGLAGYAGAGKTLAADILRAKYRYRRLSFAGALKAAVKQIYDLSNEQLYGGDKDRVDERYNITPRVILQRFGTEVCREIYPDTWVDALERQLKLDPQNEDAYWYVIDDVRFPNEVEAIRRWGGVVWKIVGREGEGVEGSHISEQPLDTGVVIENIGTEAELAVMLERVIEGSR